MIEIRRGRWWFQFVLFAVTVSLALGGLSASAQSPSPSLVRTIRAAHIFIAPAHDPSAASAGTATEEAWAAAESDAIAIATELRAITDPTARADRFAALARTRSDDTTTGANGGDLGAFTRDLMVPEFADPLFDTPSLAPGDILGPVQSGFGWHVILYQGEGDPVPRSSEAPFFDDEPTPAPTPGLTLETAGDAPRQVLRSQPAPGAATLTMTVTDVSTFEAEGIDPISATSTTTVIWDVTTDRPDAAGYVRSHLVFRDVQIGAVDGPDVTADAARRNLEAMVGLTAWVVTDVNGRVLESGVDAPDDLDATIAQSFLTLVEGYTSAPAAFPPQPVGVGARWRSVMVTPATEISTGSVSEVTTRITALDGTSVTTEATARSTQDAGSVTLPGMPKGTMVFVIGGEGSATAVVTMDLASSALESRSSGTDRTDMLVQVGEQVVHMTLRAESTITMTSTPIDPVP